MSGYKCPKCGLAITGLTIQEMAVNLGLSYNTTINRLARAGIKPILSENLYDKSALEAIRNVPGKGRPKKNAAESPTDGDASFVREAAPPYLADADETAGERASISFYDDIAAGPPVSLSDDPGWAVDVPLRHIRTKPENYCAMRVRGGSMAGSNIHDGDMVLIRRSDIPRHDAIQAVWLDGRVTLKHMVEGEGDGWTLRHDDGTGRTVPLGEENHVQGDFVLVLPPSTIPRQRD